MTAEFIVAVHALVYLNHKQSYQSSEDIAENVCTNPARIRKILTKLKNAGLVTTRLRAAGGYAFARKADEVTLRDVFQATNETLIGIRWRSGDDCAACPISRNMEPIIDRIFNRLDDAGQNILQTITIADLDGEIFPRKDESL